VSTEGAAESNWVRGEEEDKEEQGGGWQAQAADGVPAVYQSPGPGPAVVWSQGVGFWGPSCVTCDSRLGTCDL